MSSWYSDKHNKLIRYKKGGWRKQRERLLDLDENPALGHILAEQDFELVVEQLYYLLVGICPNCKITLLNDGNCSYGCGYSKHTVEHSFEAGCEYQERKTRAYVKSMLDDTPQYPFEKVVAALNR